MNRRSFWKLMQLLMVIAVLPWGINQASAGPGGGTFYANSPAGGTTGTALRKFVDSLPGLGAANANNLGQYIPVAQPDTTTYPGSDYYNIGLKDYTKKMHTDLPKATRLRGYYQKNGPDKTNQYMGPLIIAHKNRPVRLKFDNELPTGTAGNLFIPVDTEMMGAGMGPLTAAGASCDPSMPGATCAKYTQNRATVHLHGGNTPWISDGTPHQWITPAGENTPYKKGVSQRNVPDMPDPNGLTQGSATFYYTNQQSARLLFYHDHAYGLTRLNVYAGEAAGYLITDQFEEDLISGTNVSGANPTNAKVLPDLGGVYHYGIPLVIQDKTFVPQNIDVQDAAWNFKLDNSSPGPTNRPTNIARNKTTEPWGSYGDLWFPHVYEANQDPYSPDGANPFGRWDYGPWFWPVVPIDPSKALVPDPSTTPEAFMDTPVVNGTAYPYLQVAPKAYRFRILNACNDRPLNLQLYYVDPMDPTGKEVKMVPASFNPTYPADWPTDGRDGGVPDPALRGPTMVQIGTEGGFLPNPVDIPNRPVGFDYNRRNIVVLNTLYRALFLAPAERADVIIDFSSVPSGSKIILYNDAPTPNPAFDVRYDYYTGNADQSLSGGAPSTLVGVGPNIRTIMQFQVSGAASAPFNRAALDTILPAVFKASQNVPIIPEPAFNAAYGKTYSEMYGKIQDLLFTFKPLDNTGTPVATPTTIQFRNKAIQELWDPWGRMNATLGVELPFTNNVIQTTVPLGYVDPPTEYINDGQVQIWKITHNGVDTHPVHFHLFDVQLVNRVGWDGAIRPPDDNEMGWKDTLRMNPLEDVVVALKPHSQVNLPFALPISNRLLDPTMPQNALIPIIPDPYNAANVTPTANTMTNFGYEYVWHCHILGHEENDFMRTMVFNVPTTVPAAPSALTAIKGGTTVGGVTNSVTNQILLTWTDNANNAADFRVERRIGTGAYAPLTTLSFISVAAPSFTDTAVNKNTSYSYRIIAYNSKGNSVASNVSTITTPTWTSATGLTLISNKPSPHIEGTNVIFIAQGTGATATVAYQYRFSLTRPGQAKVLVQDWSTTNSWAMSAAEPASGTPYVITVDVRTTASATPERTTTMNYTIVPPPAPIAYASPVPGIYATVPTPVTLYANVPSNIFYTTDGSLPTTLSTKYTAPILLSTTTALNFIAYDISTGLASAVQSGTWYVGAQDLTSTITINNGAAAVNSPNVTINLNASDPAGVAGVSFSNDNVTYAAEIPYPNGGGATDQPWTLSNGDGPKTVYVKFRDGSVGGGTTYGPYSVNVTLDTIPPVTVANPGAGTYSSQALTVALTSNEPAAIYYTLDGSDPTVANNPSRLTYTAPLLLVANTTIKYYAVDTAGNAETVQTGTWVFGASPLNATVKINNGAAATNNTAVNLTVDATITTPLISVATMAFSNDGFTYQPAINYTNAPVPWTLDSNVNGMKTVYVQLTDSANPPVTYAPVIATIMMDTVAPVTTASPVAANYSMAPVAVTLTANEPATIYYTTDGSAPTAGAPGTSQYTSPIVLSTSTNLKYSAVDTAGNVEVAQSGQWNILGSDLTASIMINNGNNVTNNPSVTLNLNAIDPLGVDTMMLSNDNVNYGAEIPYPNNGGATNQVWALTPGDGPKTVYVRFRDLSADHHLYDPITASITLDTTAPVTTAGPIQGTYGTTPIFVTLAANEPATIKYTTDGSDPTISGTALVYSNPISLDATTTIRYYAVDTAGNAEAPKSGLWTKAVSDMVATVAIDNGATVTQNANVDLTLSADDPLGVYTMQFSNDGVTYTNEEPYATAKTWTIPSGDGMKTVYVRFRDKALCGDGTLGCGTQYTFTSTITLDTVAPVTMAGPIPGEYSTVPITVTLATNESATIYYSLDGTFPTTQYTGPITFNDTTTIKYNAVDTAGNVEAVKTGTWIAHTPDMASSVQIGNGSAFTTNASVTLNLMADDPEGVTAMQFSNDGISYSAEEAFPGPGVVDAIHTTKTWTLTPGDGLKTVYVRFRDNALPIGHLYSPVTASITVDTTPPAIIITPASIAPSSFASRTITGTKEAGATLTLDSVTSNGATHGAFAPLVSDTSWSLTLDNLPAPDAVTHKSSTTITLSSVDQAGNTTTIAADVIRAATPPGPPVMGKAVAGNKLAVVSFTPPAYDGGSAITGYTVTSIPAGGTDNNAGSTATTHTVAGLVNGIAYTFTVTATNGAGPSGASAASNSVTPAAVTTPTVAITANAKPANPSNQKSGEIAFTGVYALDFQCKLDGNGYGPCTSPYAYNNLIDGSHTFSVYSRNTDNPQKSSVVATYTWTVDTTVPLVTGFDAATPIKGLVVVPTVFTATNTPGSGVNGYMITETPDVPLATDPGWSATKPASYATTADGQKTLYAWARNKAGSVSVAATKVVTFDALAPEVTFSAPAFSKSLTIPNIVFSAADPTDSTGANGTGVTGYMITTTATVPLASAAGWIAPNPDGPTSFLTTAGTKTLYAWAKDAAGNISLPVTAKVIVDVTKPVVSAFTVTTPYSGATVPIKSFTATDAGGALFTGYLITEDANVPALNDAGWTLAKPTTYTPKNPGDQTLALYAWAKDGAGNISLAKGPVAAVLDTTAPTFTFSAPAYSKSLTIPGISFTNKSDGTGSGIAAYKITTTNTLPPATATGWLVTAPTTFAVTTAGSKDLYAWAKDKAGNVSAVPVPATVIVDVTKPVMTAFTLTSVGINVAVPVASFTATDTNGSGVDKYLITTTSTVPLATNEGWNALVPTEYTAGFTTVGTKTLYAWAMDKAGNISAVKSATVVITP